MLWLVDKIGLKILKRASTHASPKRIRQAHVIQIRTIRWGGRMNKHICAFCLSQGRTLPHAEKIVFLPRKVVTQKTSKGLLSCRGTGEQEHDVMISPLSKNWMRVSVSVM